LGFFIASVLVILAILLAIGLSYVIVQMFVLILLWVCNSINSYVKYRIIHIDDDSCFQQIKFGMNLDQGNYRPHHPATKKKPPKKTASISTEEVTCSFMEF
jgi:hypothetical protein